MLKPLDFDMGFMPDSTFKEIEEEYGLKIDNVYPFAGINGNPISLNKRSETSKKVIIRSQNKLFLLKEIPWYVFDLDQIQDILSLQQEMYETSKTMPSITKNLRGLMCVEINGEKYFIQDYLEGCSWDYSPLQCAEGGKTLKKFHSVVSSFEKKDHIKSQSIIASSLGVLGLVVKKYKEIRKNMSVAEKRNFNDFISMANVSLKELSKDLKDSDYGKVLHIVHGDYNPNNITFYKNHIVKGIYDVDNMTYDDPMHDIAEGLIDFSMMNYKPMSSRFESIDTTPNYARFNAFIKGYTNSKSDQRINALLPSCMAVIMIELICLGLLRKDWSVEQSLVYLKELSEIQRYVREFLEA